MTWASDYRFTDPLRDVRSEVVIDGTVSNLACGFDIPTTTQVGFGGGLKPGQGDCIPFRADFRWSRLDRDGEPGRRVRGATEALPRGASIVSSLEDRIAQAEERSWTGEVQQLRVSLQGTRDKIAQTSRPDGPVLLNIPVLRPPN